MIASRAKAIIREIAQDSDRVIFSNHALKRMDDLDCFNREIILAQDWCAFGRFEERLEREVEYKVVEFYEKIKTYG